MDEVQNMTVRDRVWRCLPPWKTPSRRTNKAVCALSSNEEKKKKKVWIWLILFWLVPIDKVFQTTLEMHWTSACSPEWNAAIGSDWLCLKLCSEEDVLTLGSALPLHHFSPVWIMSGPAFCFSHGWMKYTTVLGLFLERTQQSGLHCVRMQEASPAGCWGFVFVFFSHRKINLGDNL